MTKSKLIDFELHPQLQADSWSVGELSLCSIRLINDQNYPWLIAVPQRPNIKDIHELSLDDRVQLNLESHAISQVLMQLFKGHKMNIAALGNVVEQLHIHHIVRFKTDCAWPAPVWGAHPAAPYTKAQAQSVIDSLRSDLTRQCANFVPC